MTTKLKTQVYDVEIKPVKMTVEAEQVRAYAEDGKICVQTKVKVTDSIDIKESAEAKADGKIKPYGLDTPDGYDVEVKEKVEPAVVQEHIEKAIKKQSKNKK